jgi:hypothetical protein
MIGRGLLLVGLLVAGLAQAQSYRAPRSADGRPNLEGLWSGDSLTQLQRPKAFTHLVARPAAAAAYERKEREDYQKEIAPTNPDAPAPPPGKVQDESAQWSPKPVGLARVRGEIRTSWIVDPPDGRLPYTPQARTAAEKALSDEEVFDDPEARPFDERCLLGGGGGVAAPIMSSMLIQIVQTRDNVVLLGESNHDARIVPLEGRHHSPAGIGPWMGDQVGRWQGDTLVIETTNLSPSDRWRWNAGVWIPLTSRARIVERFRRIGRDELLYAYRVEDPGAYTRTWRGEMPLHRAPGAMLEYACHEGNYSLHNILAGARAQERATTKATPPAR